ncbi:hypothetical protein XENTR_v10024806 [Xenopus tropicalis]|nr:hypothetical protein XENTR_v10024806 [Xenopus tropicalis]
MFILMFQPKRFLLLYLPFNIDFPLSPPVRSFCTRIKGRDSIWKINLFLKPPPVQIIKGTFTPLAKRVLFRTKIFPHTSKGLKHRNKVSLVLNCILIVIGCWQVSLGQPITD